jgi:hypothetical protein
MFNDYILVTTGKYLHFTNFLQPTSRKRWTIPTEAVHMMKYSGRTIVTKGKLQKIFATSLLQVLLFCSKFILAMGHIYSNKQSSDNI